MSEINVKISGVEDAITKLQNLQKQSASIGITKPATVGGGEVVGYLEEIADVYRKIYANFVSLVGNTIGFLENMRDSYAESDQKAADAFRDQ